MKLTTHIHLCVKVYLETTNNQQSQYHSRGLNQEFLEYGSSALKPNHGSILNSQKISTLSRLCFAGGILSVVPRSVLRLIPSVTQRGVT